MDKPKYIKDAIMWNMWAGKHGAWMRISDMNLIVEDNDEYYMYAASGNPKFTAKTVFPYEDWMEEYIGTDKNIRHNGKFKYDY
jgi:hypothetical protein